MTSLTDVYRRRVGAAGSRRQVLGGLAGFALGAVLVAVGIALATTGVGSGLGYYGAREWAGILAGLGLPMALLGVFAALPASRVARAAAAIGASLCVFALALFVAAYPYHWPGAPGANPLLALGTLVIYFAGAATTMWCLFVAVATFRTRKAPGGTAEMRITEEGQIELVADRTRTPGLGGIGLFGTDPDGEVPTQTGSAGTTDRGQETTHAVSDGGSAAAGRNEGGPDTPGGPGTDPVDRYCGNCRHFHYLRTDDEIEPYCDYHTEYLDDLDACAAWQASQD